MSLYTPISPTELQPQDVIEFSNITELSKFEDFVVSEIDPEMTESMINEWAIRITIKSLIRPSKFNGTIGDISLIVMDEPYERIRGARTRGIEFTRDGGVPDNHLKTEFSHSNTDKYKGFILTANAKSSKPIRGQIQSELYYYPIPLIGVQRVVAKPKYETKEFIEIDEESRRISFGDLRST